MQKQWRLSTMHHLLLLHCNLFYLSAFIYGYQIACITVLTQWCLVVYIYASMLINSKNGVSPFQSLHQWWFIVNWTLKTSCIGILMKVPGTLWIYFHNCDGHSRPICIHCDWDHTIWTKTRGLVRGCGVLLELGILLKQRSFKVIWYITVRFWSNVKKPCRSGSCMKIFIAWYFWKSTFEMMVGLQVWHTGKQIISILLCIYQCLTIRN